MYFAVTVELEGSNLLVSSWVNTRKNVTIYMIVKNFETLLLIYFYPLKR